jgi:solute carrier family 66, member 2
MKMFWFFTSTTSIPWAFKVCGMFQAFCDALLGVQYFMYGSEASKAQTPDRPYELQPNGFTTASGHDSLPGRRTSTSEKAI